MPLVSLSLTALMGASLLAVAPETSASSSGGAISGVVRDRERGAPLEDAVVIVSCTCLSDPIELHTNKNGLFAATKLPAGVYSLYFAFGDGEARDEVRLGSGEKKRLRVPLDPGGDIREVHVKSPVTSKPGPIQEIDSKALENLPGNGAGTGVIETAMDINPHGTDDAGGKAMIGHTSAETDYRVKGASLNDPAFGKPSISPVAEFVEAVTVSGSGYDAEFGGYSGGVVDIRRKSGSNVTRGRARFSFIPRLAKPRFVVRTDNAVRATEVPDYQIQGVISLSGPIIKDRLFWSAGVMALGTRSTLTQTFHSRVDKDGSGGFEDCPYENGANDCVDGGNYLLTKKFAEQEFPTSAVRAQAFGGLDWAINPRHRLDWTTFVSPGFIRRSYRRPVNLSALDPDALGASPNADPVGGGATVANGIVNGAFGWDRINSTQNVLAYQGRVAKDAIEIDASVSYFQSKFVEAWRLDDPTLALTPATQERDADGRNLFGFLDNEQKLGLVPFVDQECNAADLPGESCPVRTWLSGGVGQTQWSRSRRVGGNFALTHFFQAAGSHQLKWGTQIEHTERTRRLQYSGSNDSDFYENCDGDAGGGEWCYNETDGYSVNGGPRVDNHRLILVDSDNPNARTSLGYGRVRREAGELRAISTPLGAGIRSPRYEGTVSTQNYGFFLQDKWAILDNLFVSGGVRWDMQDMRDILGRRAIFIWDNIAPRASVVYDWTHEGRSRLYASYGWFYQQLPLSLLNRVYGGQVNVVRRYEQDVCNNPVTIDGEPMSRSDNGQPTEWCRDSNETTTGLTEGATVPRLKGQYDQQWTVGYDHEVIEDLTLGVSWLHSDLGQAVEDVSVNGGLDFIVANPGTAVAQSDLDAQQAECTKLDREISNLPSDSPALNALQREKNRCEFLVNAFSKVGTMFTPPKRTTDSFSFVATKRFAKSWMLIGSYTYSRSIGNYDGFVDPITGAVNIGSSLQYDTPELVRNSFGPLSFDSPHRMKVDAFRIFDIPGAGALTAGGSLRVRSGYPISLRGGSSRHPNRFPIYILPRGKGGRMQANYQVNVSLQYAYPIMARRKKKKDEDAREAMMLGLGVRLFNVTNAKSVLRVDEVYSFQNTRAVAGGDLNDLKHTKVQSASRPDAFFQRDIVRKQGNYGVEAAFQQPLAAQFDVNLVF